MSTIKTWLKTLKDHDMRAYNRVSSRDLALCFNFIQIPDTNSITLTVSVMKNKTKKNSLAPDSFSKVMRCLEEGLSESLSDYKQSGTIDTGIFFTSVKNLITDQWYVQLCCHRVFFIPVDGLWDTIKNLFAQNNIQYITSCGITEVSVIVNTQEYDCNIKFY